MMSSMQLVVSMVSPQKYMKPITSTNVNMTETRTRMAPVTFASMKTTMRKTQMRARAMLRINSSDRISSTSQNSYWGKTQKHVDVC